MSFFIVCKESVIVEKVPLHNMAKQCDEKCLHDHTNSLFVSPYSTDASSRIVLFR